MIDALYQIDVAVFYFINTTIANPVSDALWPLITDYVQFWPVRIGLLGVWLWLVIKGGRTGRTVAVLIVVVIFAADRLSSGVLKELIGRARPCHTVDGVPVLPSIHMLVHCGPGKSFPSSHAVNNFALATVFAFYYRKWIWAFLAWASLVALSRPAVGVHYPSDILGGAVLGTALALAMISLWQWLERRLRTRRGAVQDGRGE